jgi:cysteine sulfinate desulfinase/cysteine desulfurase-like protein
MHLIQFLRAHAEASTTVMENCFSVMENLHIRPVNLDKETLLKKLKEHKGEFGVQFDPENFKGEKSYMELGAWVGDQTAAILMMAVGSNLGLWEGLSPSTMGLRGAIAQTLFENGFFTITSTQTGDGS